MSISTVNPSFSYEPPHFPSFEVLYYDNDLLILNKPSGLLSVPGKALEHKDSLQTRVQRVWPNASIVHRLDMATSGLMIMAQNKSAHRHISKQFETRLVSKTYFAKVMGKPEQDKGTIELPLICDWPNRPKQMVDFERGKKACTHWQYVHTETTKGHKVSLIKLQPITGRSHQLRVHMQAIGHDIIGDKLYASEIGKSLSSRLCLHASSISFKHPSTQKSMHFDYPHPF